MTEEIRNDYECSSEGAVLHWPIPYARLTDATPTVSLPAEVTSVLPGTQLTGTILSIDAGDSIAVIDFTAGMVYWHEVRNVLTYAAAVEATWGAINIGDPVYYDSSATMPAGVYLSTSPLDNVGGANTLFGHVVPCLTNSDDPGDYPKGGVTASTQECGVAQIGVG